MNNSNLFRNVLILSIIALVSIKTATTAYWFHHLRLLHISIIPDKYLTIMLSGIFQASIPILCYVVFSRALGNWRLALLPILILQVGLSTYFNFQAFSSKRVENRISNELAGKIKIFDSQITLSNGKIKSVYSAQLNRVRKQITACEDRRKKIKNPRLRPSCWDFAAKKNSLDRYTPLKAKIGKNGVSDSNPNKAWGVLKTNYESFYKKYDLFRKFAMENRLQPFNVDNLQKSFGEIQTIFSVPVDIKVLAFNELNSFFFNPAKGQKIIYFFLFLAGAIEMLNFAIVYALVLSKNAAVNELKKKLIEEMENERLSLDLLFTRNRNLKTNKLIAELTNRGVAGKN